MDKEIVIHKHTLECFSAIKKMEILPFGTTQMDLNSITLSEISQRKTNTVWSHYVCVFGEATHPIQSQDSNTSFLITQDGPSESFPRIFLLELEGKSLCILSDKELSECWTVHSISASWKSWLERKCWYAGWNREREHPDGVKTCDPSLPRPHVHSSLIRWSSKLDPGMQLGEEVRELEQQEPDPQGPEEGILILFWGQREDIKAGA